MCVMPGITASPSRSARPTRARSSSTSAASTPPSVRRSQSRRSSATWSLRERPVWSFAATGPSRSPRAASRLRWTSSSAGSQANLPAATSAVRASSPPTSSASSTAVTSPARASPCTCAIEPRRSSAARARSTSIERVKSAASGSVPVANRPPHMRIVPPSSCAECIRRRRSEEAHRAEHVAGARGHPHGGTDELHVHEVEAEGPVTAALPPALPVTRTRFLADQRRAIELGSLYALGHASVVAALGLAALAFAALLPAWVDPIMGRVVGVTLIVLGVWVLYSVYAYLRHGTEFRLRSRWMLVFDSFRYAWRWMGARIHGHEHV